MATPMRSRIADFRKRIATEGAGSQAGTVRLSPEPALIDGRLRLLDSWGPFSASQMYRWTELWELLACGGGGQSMIRTVGLKTESVESRKLSRGALRRHWRTLAMLTFAVLLLGGGDLATFRLA